jgi:hypothetical protein
MKILLLIKVFFVLSIFSENILNPIFSKTRWEKTEYLWNLGIAQCSSTIHTIKPQKYFIERGSKNTIPYVYVNNSIIWINPDMLRDFFLNQFQIIKKPFVLVICDGDNTFPCEVGLSTDELNLLISDPKIIHIFAQNNRIAHCKISSIPIGIDFHTQAYKNEKKISPKAQEQILKNIIHNSKPIEDRLDRVFVDFQHNDNIRNGDYKRYLELNEDRRMIFEELLKTNLIDYTDNKLDRSKLWEVKSNYTFTVSPHGNGLDCHRTWEDLALGCIVIVKSSPIDNLYEDLPVVIIKDWNQITEENLKKWKEKFSSLVIDKSYYKKLKNDYWTKKIMDKANENN